MAVEVRSITSRPVRRRGMKPLVEATVVDETGIMKATFFNQPWLERRYRPGTRLMLQGKYQGRNRFRVQFHAQTGEQVGAGGDVATYPATDGLSTTQIAALVREHRGALGDVVEPLPARMRVAGRWPDRAGALGAAHFGDQESGRVRLAFEELLLLQIALLRRRALRREAARAEALDDPPSLTRALARRVAAVRADRATRSGRWRRSTADLAAGRPMQRLLMGEVGSGKTVVALYAMLRAVEHGAQAALMAPTETLAEQHFATLQKLMPGELVQAALLTGSTSGGPPRGPARQARERRAEAAGRHARADRGRGRVRPARRRGRRRAAPLRREPAPRAGPQGAGRARAARAAHDRDADPAHARADRVRRPRRHRAAPAARRAGSRSRPTSPRPSASASARTSGSARSCAPAARRSSSARSSRSPRRCRPAPPRPSTSGCARTELRDFRVVLLHGQMKPREKQEAMAAFAAGGADVLVATTVIEVGIDVPNASVMLVEGAERYGISQLHQLRGRIGRGSHESVCVLFGPKESARLRALAEHGDGFKLAEIDLELRGEGEMLGTRQSGLAQFRVARLPEDAELLDGAREIGAALLEADPELVAARARAARLGGAGGLRRRGARPDPRVSPRVIAGRYGGRRLQAPPGDATRPTADRVREALFSILGARVAGRARARPLRRLGRARASRRSRAAPREVTFVDTAPAALRALRANLAALGADAEVVRADALRWLRAAPARARQYDLVFLDPPYRRAAALGARALGRAPRGAGAGRAGRHGVRPPRPARARPCP